MNVALFSRAGDGGTVAHGPCGGWGVFFENNTRPYSPPYRVGTDWVGCMYVCILLLCPSIRLNLCMVHGIRLSSYISSGMHGLG